MSTPAVEAISLRKNYGPLRAVDDIDFSIEHGEYFGILGPNGAGKTTTVGMVYCFLPVDGGTLTVLGMDTQNSRRAIKSRLGVVPQENNLDLELSVLDNLVVYASYFGIPKKTARDRALEQLEFFGLSAKRDVEVESLSGGMKRRLTIARAMMNKPELLILDEPTTGLDPEARHNIWQHLKNLKKEGLTLILTTHYLEEASRLCDRILIMDEGRILEEGAPFALMDKHIGAQVLEAALDKECHPELIQAAGDQLRGHLTIGETLYLHPAGSMAELARRVRDFPGVERLTERPANLEDVFLKLTGRRFGIE